MKTKSTLFAVLCGLLVTVAAIAADKKPNTEALNKGAAGAAGK
jgi:hypothetical protein